MYTNRLRWQCTLKVWRSLAQKSRAAWKTWGHDLMSLSKTSITSRIQLSRYQLPIHYRETWLLLKTMSVPTYTIFGRQIGSHIVRSLSPRDTQLSDCQLQTDMTTDDEETALCYHWLTISSSAADQYGHPRRRWRRLILRIRRQRQEGVGAPDQC
jgi:hypothetical protein